MSLPVTEYTIPNKTCADCGRVILPGENFSSYVSDGRLRCTGCSKNAPVSLAWSGSPNTAVIMPVLTEKEEDVPEERSIVKTSFTVTREVKRKVGLNHQVHYDSRTKQLEIKGPLGRSTVAQIPREDLGEVILALECVLQDIERAES